jgi:hypothetical protein
MSVQKEEDYGEKYEPSGTPSVHSLAGNSAAKSPAAGNREQYIKICSLLRALFQTLKLIRYQP